MRIPSNKSHEKKSQLQATEEKHNGKIGAEAAPFLDKRSEAVAQLKLQEIAHNSPQAKQAVQLQAMADNSSSQQQQPIQKKENNTGLPDNLKAGVENLSGYSMDDVKVHHNSDKPAQLQAHAYAQGTDIHLGPGQEKHLPHEAWHVVQQKQGRVKPTMQMKGKINVNDDAGLEKEADVMGEKAAQRKPITSQLQKKKELISSNELVVQRQLEGNERMKAQMLSLLGSGKIPTDLEKNIQHIVSSDQVITLDSGGWNYMQAKQTLSLPVDALDKILEGEPQNQINIQNISALSHEVTHIMDHLMGFIITSSGDSNPGEEYSKVMETELKAWFIEARTALKLAKGNTHMLSEEHKSLVDGYIGYKEGELEMLCTMDSGTMSVFHRRLLSYLTKNLHARDDKIRFKLLKHNQAAWPYNNPDESLLSWIDKKILYYQRQLLPSYGTADSEEYA